jgi:hypothetical protein
MSAGDVPPQTPSRSLAPSPNFTGDGNCTYYVLDDSSKCTTDVAKAVNNGRSVLESMAPLSFDLGKFEAMTTPQQLFVIANEERIDRGLAPIAGLTTQLDDVSQTAANNNADPHLSDSTLTGGASVRAWGSNWAGGTSNALGSDYYWMYDDGTSSPNSECSSPGASACWGHRNNVLGTFVSSSTCSTSGSSGPEQYMGAADVPSGSSTDPSFAEIIVGACGTPPTDVVFTWAQAQELLDTSGGGGGATAPGAPQNVSAAGAAKKGVVVTWQAPAENGGSAITKYEIFRSRAAGTEKLYATEVCNTTSCTYVNRHAGRKKMFFYQVAAVNSVGTGPSSSEVSARAS